MPKRVAQRRRRGRFHSIVAVSALLAAAAPVVRAELVWDPNGATAGTGGDGAWNNVSPFWFNTATSNYQAWSNAFPQLAVFGGTGGTVVPGNGIVATAGMRFDAPGYVIANGWPITLGGVITLNAPATIGSVAAGSIVKSGAADLTLSGDNTHAGSTIVGAGRLIATNSSAFGTSAGVTVVNDGTTLVLKGVQVLDEPLYLSGAGVGGTEGVLRAEGADSYWGGPINFATHSTIVVQSSTLQVFGQLSGSGNLIARGEGSGTHTLDFTSTATHTWNGGLTVDGATVAFNADAITLSSLSFTANGGVLKRSSNVASTFSGPVSLAAGGTGEFNLSPSNLTLTGALTGAGTLAKSNSKTLFVNGDTSGFTGAILVKEGTLQLGAATTFGPGHEINITGGYLALPTPTHLGTSPVIHMSGTSSNTANLLLLESGAFSPQLVVDGNAGPSISVATGKTVTLAAGTTLTGPADGVWIREGGPGTLRIETALPNLKELTIEGGGTVVVTDPLALGTLAGPVNRGSVHLSGGLTIANKTRSNGELRTLSGSNTWSGGVSGPVTTFTTDGGTSLAVTGVISSGSVTKQGTGELILSGSGNNTFTGPVVITEGSVRVRHGGAFGTSVYTPPGFPTPFVPFDTTVQPGARIDFENNISVPEPFAVSGTQATGALRNLSGDNFLAGDIELKGDTRFVANAGSLNLSRILVVGSATYKVVIGAGGGRVVMTSTASNWAGTDIEGELELKSNALLGGSNAGTQIKGGGALRLTSTTVSLETLTLGDATGPATIRTSGGSQWTGNGVTTWTMLNDAVVDVDGVNSGAFVVQPTVAGNGHTLTKRGSGRLTMNGAITGLDRVVVEQGWLVVPALSGAHLQMTPAVTNTATVSLLGASTLSSLSGGPGATGGDTSLAITNGATLTVNQAIDTTYSGLISPDSAANTLTKTGVGTLSLTGFAPSTAVIVNGGALAVNTSVAESLAGISLGGGTFRALQGFNIGTGVTLNAGGGTIDTNGVNPKVGSVAGTGAFTKSGVGTLTVTHVRTGGTLSVTGGRLSISGVGSTATSTAASVSITGTGQIDLRSAKLITNMPAGLASAGVYDGLQGLVQKGHNGGAWNGTGGIMTTLPAAAGGSTAIGVATGAQAKGLSPGQTALFGGLTITDTSTIAMYTYAGDANLDGQITGDDYSGIDFAILAPGTSGWVNGDFNYDGLVTGDDYSAIDFNIIAQGAPFPTSAVPAVGISLASASGVTAVPEPGALGLVSVAAAALSCRRRRRG